MSRPGPVRQPADFQEVVAVAGHRTRPVGVGVCTSCTGGHSGTVGSGTWNLPGSCRAGRYRHQHRLGLPGLQGGQSGPGGSLPRWDWFGVPPERADTPETSECRPGSSDTWVSAWRDPRRPRCRGQRRRAPNRGTPDWLPGGEKPCRRRPTPSSQTSCSPS